MIHVRVIVMKNRRAEFGAMKTLLDSRLLSDELVPYVEVIREGGIYDVASWSNLFKERPLFVDYLRCDVRKYRGHDPEQIQLIYQLNNNIALYERKVLGLARYANVIPVISIREGIDKIEPGKAESLIADLRQARNGNAVAVRIENFAGYEHLLTDCLSDEDYLFYDISEQRIDAKFFEHIELRDLGIQAHCGILCSNRSRDVSNRNYENGCPTVLINCDASSSYSKYGYEFYGDYGGLKDSLPSKGGNGQGCALAVLFDANINQYRTYVCDDLHRGVEGYSDVITEILNDQEILDPDNECIALSMIRSMQKEGKTGNWETWIKITLLRTAQQLNRV